MTLLPWALLASTLTVRYLIARHSRMAFYVDLLSVPAWTAFYVSTETWPLLCLPWMFAATNLMALRNRKWAK